MHNKFYDHFSSFLLPCIIFSAITGLFSALLITLFKVAAEWVIHLSLSLYEAVRTNPAWIPALIIGAALIGVLASLILSVSHSCKGGCIPTSVAAIQGIFSFRWFSGVVLLPVSALLSFLVGLPLGTEGPCVQMGTAVGDGVMKGFGKEKHSGWRRYIMTGGASAGFSIATGSPITAIIFSVEELHKHFSPVLLSIASISVITAQTTSRALASIGIGEMELFSIHKMEALPVSLFLVPIILGLVSGICSIFFIRLYHLIDHVMRTVLKRISVKVIIPILFALVAVAGFLFADALRSGHSLINSLFTPGAAWYMLIILFLLRAIGMMVCNTSGATGGVFLPTLAFGAIIGTLCADLLIWLGLMGTEHYVLAVVLGISAFLSATSRIPLTACIFAVEALGGINNVLPIVIATTVAIMSVEASGLEDLTDKIIEARLHKLTRGKKPFEIEAPLTVKRNAFVIGKEMRDVLWPNSCLVVAFNRADISKRSSAISEGDVITVRYITYDPSITLKEICDLVGKQNEETVRTMNPLSDNSEKT